MEQKRSDRRFHIEVPVFVGTVLDGQDAYIVDVSKQGVQLRGCTAQPRMRVIIEFQGGTVCGTVRWAKPDGTVGVRLDTPLEEGPLAAIWTRFNKNVTAFAERKPRAQPSFGQKSL